MGVLLHKWWFRPSQVPPSNTLSQTSSPMATITQLAALCAVMIFQGVEAAVTFAIPSKAGVGGHSYAPLDPAPLGISFEFFAFPSYLTNVTATNKCLSNWKDLTGVWPPIRIGGTTQDRASYDASTSAYVVYSVANPADAPMTLTFGPKFMTLAGTYPGSVVVGLNRGKNNIDNTIAAAKVAVAEVRNLLAIELGNEPECKLYMTRGNFKTLTCVETTPRMANPLPAEHGTPRWTLRPR